MTEQHLKFDAPKVNASCEYGPNSEEIELIFQTFSTEGSKRLLEIWTNKFNLNPLFPVSNGLLEAAYGGSLKTYIASRCGQNSMIDMIKIALLNYKHQPEVKNG